MLKDPSISVCPWCRKNSVLNVRVELCACKEHSWIYVVCERCGAKGPSVMYRNRDDRDKRIKEAVTRWNEWRQE